MINLRVFGNSLSERWNVMTGVTLTCDVNRVFNQIPWIILEKVEQKVDEVISCLRCIIYDFVADIS
jgi:hypothetical protein